MRDAAIDIKPSEAVSVDDTAQISGTVKHL
jgi:hypothetical protein